MSGELSAAIDNLKNAISAESYTISVLKDMQIRGHEAELHAKTLLYHRSVLEMAEEQLTSLLEQQKDQEESQREQHAAQLTRRRRSIVETKT